jgi:hypothetical protein
MNESPLFVLMDGGAATDKTEARSWNKGRGGELNVGEEAREKMDRDEPLPLTVFET